MSSRDKQIDRESYEFKLKGAICNQTKREKESWVVNKSLGIKIKKIKMDILVQNHAMIKPNLEF